MRVRLAAPWVALVLVLALAEVRGQTTPVQPVITDLGGGCTASPLWATWTPGIPILGLPPCAPIAGFYFSGILTFSVPQLPAPVLVLGVSLAQIDLSWISPGCILAPFPALIVPMVVSGYYVAPIWVPCDPALLTSPPVYAQAAWISTSPASGVTAVAFTNTLAVTFN